MLIDTHSHINSEKLKDVLPEIIKNLDIGQVQRVICPSFSLESSMTSLQLAKENSKIFCALGVHPENATEWNKQSEDFLISNCNHEKVVAVGEIGLDYHYGVENKEKQFEVLNKQIEIASKFNLPIIFHIRDSFDDFLEWLKDNRQKFSKGVVHCFEGDEVIAQKILDYDLMLSFTGLVTFKPREDIRRAVKMAPLDKIMVETDAPYLAPEPYRGTLNRPENTELVAQKIAQIKGIEYDKVAVATTENAYNFFDKMRKFDERR